MFWKKAGLMSVILAALAIVAYAQTSTRQRAHSTNLQVAMAPGYLGVGWQELTPERVKALSLKDGSGVEVTRVDPDTPAQKAGIRMHDVILEISGQKISNGQDFLESIAGKAPGTKITLKIIRGNTNQNLTATLAPRPPEEFLMPAMPAGSVSPMTPEDFQALIAGDAPRVGFDGASITPQLAEFFGVAQGEGVLVVTVVEKTPAERSGLKAGDIVTKVNGIPVSNPREISGIIRQAKKVVFTVVRNKKEITLNVELAWNRPTPFDENAFN